MLVALSGLAVLSRLTMVQTGYFAQRGSRISSKRKDIFVFNRISYVTFWLQDVGFWIPRRSRYFHTVWDTQDKKRTRGKWRRSLSIRRTHCSSVSAPCELWVDQSAPKSPSSRSPKSFGQVGIRSSDRERASSQFSSRLCVDPLSRSVLPSKKI